ALDGNLWFTENSANRLGTITTAGVVDDVPVPTAASGPHGIAAGPDGKIWFTEFDAGRIGRATVGLTVLALASGPSPATVSVSQGGLVAWTFLGPGAHSATDTSGMGLFDS